MDAPTKQLPHWLYQTPLPCCHRPREYSSDRHTWVKDDRKRSKAKPSYAFIWPKDGKRGSTLGRMQDILSGKGPDMHLSISANKRDHMFSRQKRPRWSNWTALDGCGPSSTFGPQRSAPWTQMGMLGGRDPGAKYDFRTRRYGVPNQHTWTDAVWQSNADGREYPKALRTVEGLWYQNEEWLPRQFNSLCCDGMGRHIRV